VNVTLEAERMVHGGHALARLDSGEVCLIRGAIPGETVRTELARASGVLRGEALEVLRASPDRVTPPAHPGLDLGHIAYARQLELKRDVVADAMHRAGLQAAPNPVHVTPSPLVWGYRNVVQPAVTNDGLGYRRPDTHDTVTLDLDPTANDALQASWQALLDVSLQPAREIVLRGNDQGDVLAAAIVPVADDATLAWAKTLMRGPVTGVAVAAETQQGRFRAGKAHVAGKRRLLQRYGALDLTVSATAFAQPNPAAASGLVEALLAMPLQGDRLLDMYGGSGLFGLHLAERFNEVTVVDTAAESIERGRGDAARLGLENVHFARGDARRLEIDRADTVLVDPPRAGLAKPLRQTITNSDARTLVYVACDPASWARDVTAFAAQGWTLEEVQPFDFQPHTHHIELLSRLVR
jgi:tRNA/tmRNA/rRNA uracil-C5-methylase (TrmA/RlmC/RlmD family)